MWKTVIGNNNAVSAVLFHCVYRKYRNLLSPSFSRNFVKATDLLKSWFVRVTVNILSFSHRNKSFCKLISRNIFQVAVFWFFHSIYCAIRKLQAICFVDFFGRFLAQTDIHLLLLGFWLPKFFKILTWRLCKQVGTSIQTMKA